MLSTDRPESLDPHNVPHFSTTGLKGKGLLKPQILDTSKSLKRWKRGKLYTNKPVFQRNNPLLMWYELGRLHGSSCNALHLWKADDVCCCHGGIDVCRCFVNERESIAQQVRQQLFENRPLFSISSPSAGRPFFLQQATVIDSGQVFCGETSIPEDSLDCIGIMIERFRILSSVKPLDRISEANSSKIA